jgi:hypothetical protein
MAVLTVTEVTNRLPVGDKFMKTFRTSALGTNATDEWIATGLSWIDAVVGAVIDGIEGDEETLNFVKNAQGTAATAGANPGDLGIEANEAATNVVEVTVLGRM